MTALAFNRACPIRSRRIKDEMVGIRHAIIDVLKADHPQTVRQVFYQLVVRNAIEKTEAEYQGTVIRMLSDMRLAGEVPWGWIVDESRRTRVTQTFNSINDALEDTAKTYRRSALRDCDSYVEIWCEKEALSGIIWDAASDYDVPVVVSKGMPSLTQVYASFLSIKRAAGVGKCSYLYQFGDHDPTGCLIPKSIQRRLDEFCDTHDCLPTQSSGSRSLNIRSSGIACPPGRPSATATPTPKSSSAIASNSTRCLAERSAIWSANVSSGTSTRTATRNPTRGRRIRTRGSLSAG